MTDRSYSAVRFRVPVPPLVVLAFLVAGALVGAWTDARVGPFTARDATWFAGLLLTGAPVVARTLRGLLHGEFAADVVATLAITGAVLLQQPLAGLVIVLMQTGGEALEAMAVARASNAVAALEADAPQRANRLRDDGATETVDAARVAVGDRLLVRAGELVPADVVVESGTSPVDTSRLTGEPVPVTASAGTPLPSGAVNGDGALVVRAVRVAAESQYARIVELVRSAQASKSPLQRTADRWAVWFTPLTLIACAVAWFVSRDATRVLAVLVVATPCPLLLAAPVAIIGGINRAARRGIIMRSGGALEGLSRVDVALFDKTGTLTVGRPSIAEVVADGGGDTDALLALAAAAEQGSGHLLARVVVAEATARGLAIPAATSHRERAGQGVEAQVGARRVAVGSRAYIREVLPASAGALERLDGTRGGLRAYVATDDGAAARIDFADALRPDLAALFPALEREGVRDVELLTGDAAENAERVARALGIPRWAGDLSPADKVARVRELEAAGRRVLMVGDGTNDAPALSSATAGVALAGHGGGVTAEAADVVLLVDEPLRVAEAVRIGRYAMRVARQSIGAGLGLSVIGMGFAVVGLLTPTVGALVQEGIDVAVIVWALRAARG